MKIFKIILKILLSLIILIIITVAVFMIIIYDGSTAEFDYNDSLTIERVLGEGLDQSLNTIASLDSEERKSDKNKIVVAITIDELNNFLVDTVRSQINSNYFDGGHCINTHRVYDPNDIHFNMPINFTNFANDFYF